MRLVILCVSYIDKDEEITLNLIDNEEYCVIEMRNSNVKYEALLKDDFRLEVAFFDNLEYYWLILPTEVLQLQRIYTIILCV